MWNSIFVVGKNILSLCLVCGWLGYQRARSITWVGRTHKGKCKAFSTIKVKLGQNYLLSVPEKGFLDILHFRFLSFRDPSHLFWWNPINNSIKLMRVTLLHKSTPQFCLLSWNCSCIKNFRIKGIQEETAGMNLRETREFLNSRPVPLCKSSTWNKPTRLQL